MTRAVAAPAQLGLPNRRLLRATADRAQSVRTAGEVAQRTPTARFRAVVRSYWKKNGRHDLPWRRTKDPYRIMVSEVMLQQTQVSRVIEKYRSFLKKFPTIKKLADAKLSEVLEVWSGLGYNRRGKYLHDAAKTIVEKHGGKVPRDFALLRALPGMGLYTASAVRVFAFNEPDILIETNIRTTYIQLTGFISGFTKSRYEKFRDDELLSVATTAAKGQDPRSWHWALMDYGAHLKRMGVRNNHKSAHYAKQSKFEGSLRQVRGAILRALSQDEEINDLRNRYKGFVEKGLAGLKRDGLIVKEKGKWRIA